MGFFKRWFARMSREAWEEARAEKNAVPLTAAIGANVPRGDNTPKNFSIHTALNGTYISCSMHKFNPNGPDEYTNEVYLVRDDETIVDAVAAVLVLMDARSPR